MDLGDARPTARWKLVLIGIGGGLGVAVALFYLVGNDSAPMARAILVIAVGLLAVARSVQSNRIRRQARSRGPAPTPVQRIIAREWLYLLGSLGMGVVALFLALVGDYSGDLSALILTVSSASYVGVSIVRMTFWALRTIRIPPAN